MLQASGILYLGATAPAISRSANGTFVLTLRAFDSITPHQESYRLISWSGPDAEYFYQQRDRQLSCGQALYVSLNRIQPLAGKGRQSSPVIFANVLLLYLAPIAEQPRTKPCTAIAVSY
jgi:hypothetical protein